MRKPQTPSLGIITGLASEARAARAAAQRAGLSSAQVLIRCAGPGLQRAQEAAQSLLAQGAESLLSFGLAGALKPGFAPGKLLLPRRVVAADGPPLRTDSGRADAIAFALASAVPISREDLVSVGIVVSSDVEKTKLAEAANAAAVDMESYAVGQAAAAARKPFLVLRAIADPADRTIPAVAQRGMGPDGRIHPLSVLLALAREPKTFGELARLALETREAMRALSRAARLALPVLLLEGHRL